MESDYVPLITVDCSSCGRPTVVTPLCVRPDLCHPCFTAGSRVIEQAGKRAAEFFEMAEDPSFLGI